MKSAKSLGILHGTLVSFGTQLGVVAIVHITRWIYLVPQDKG
jgi:hypothetical protein